MSWAALSSAAWTVVLPSNAGRQIVLQRGVDLRLVRHRRARLRRLKLLDVGRQRRRVRRLLRVVRDLTTDIWPVLAIASWNAGLWVNAMNCSAAAWCWELEVITMSSPPTTLIDPPGTRRHRRVGRLEGRVLRLPDALHPRTVEDVGVVGLRQTVLTSARRPCYRRAGSGSRPACRGSPASEPPATVCGAVEVAGRRRQVRVGDLAAARPDPRQDVPALQAAVGEHRDVSWRPASARRSGGRRTWPAAREMPAAVSAC